MNIEDFFEIHKDVKITDELRSTLHQIYKRVICDKIDSEFMLINNWNTKTIAVKIKIAYIKFHNKERINNIFERL
jgi:hypothetical protein